jgi:hypothetical protein
VGQASTSDCAGGRVGVTWNPGTRKVVGAAGFEPAAPCAQGRCATRLRYAPTLVRRSPKAKVDCPPQAEGRATVSRRSPIGRRRTVPRTPNGEDETLRRCPQDAGRPQVLIVPWFRRSPDQCRYIHFRQERRRRDPENAYLKEATSADRASAIHCLPSSRGVQCSAIFARQPAPHRFLYKPSSA